MAMIRDVSTIKWLSNTEKPTRNADQNFYHGTESAEAFHRPVPSEIKIELVWLTSLETSKTHTKRTVFLKWLSGYSSIYPRTYTKRHQFP